MKRYFLLIALISLIGTYSQAQHQCSGFHDEDDHTNFNNNTSAFECNNVDCTAQVQEWMENCDEVWVDIIIHFLIIGDCNNAPNIGSNTIPVDQSLQNSYDIAEAMVDEANEMLSNYEHTDQLGQDIWGLPENDTDPVCMPIRWRMAGIEFHCLSSANTGNCTGDILTLSESNPTALNVLMTPVAGDASGFACANGVIMEQFSGDLLNHELLHSLGLGHAFDGPFQEENCDDVPIFPTWTWNNPNVPSEETSGFLCYDIYPPDSPYCLGPVPHPCCNECLENNNTMTYSHINNDPEQAALTPCQIETALTDLCENHCHQISDVVPEFPNCNPPSAFIDLQDYGIFQSADCDICFQMSPSFNEFKYKLLFIENSGNTSSIVTSTGWTFGEAGAYCLNYNKLTNSWGKYFKPGRTYTLILTVQTRCGDTDTDQLTFSTPRGCPDKEDEDDSDDDDDTTDCFDPIIRQILYTEATVNIAWEAPRGTDHFTVNYESTDGTIKQVQIVSNTNKASFKHYDKTYSIRVRSDCTKEDTPIKDTFSPRARISNSSNSLIGIYPNPLFGADLKIEINDVSIIQSSPIVQVQIVDLLGNLIYDEAIDFTNQLASISTSNIDSGTYTIKLKTENNYQFYRKLVLFSDK